jgi:hypothetical protein
MNVPQILATGSIFRYNQFKRVICPKYGLDRYKNRLIINVLLGSIQPEGGRGGRRMKMRGGLSPTDEEE